MKLPDIPYKENSGSASISVFRGLNLTEAAADGNLTESWNLTPEGYPALKARAADAQVGAAYPSNINGMLGWEKLIVAAGKKLYLDGTEVGTDLLTDTAKQLCVIGRTLVVWPDKLLVDLDMRTAENMEAAITAGHVSIPLPAENASFNAGDGPCVQSIVLFEDEYTGSKIIPGDYVTIEGFTLQANNKHHAKISEISSTGYNTCYFSTEKFYAPTSFYYCSFRLNKGKPYSYSGHAFYPEKDYTQGSQIMCWEKGSGALTNGPFLYIWDKETGSVESLTIQTISSPTILSPGSDYEGEDGGITISRKTPNMDYICSYNNRLWGVSNADRTIYASALGLPKVWYDYSGVSTDSYAVAVESPGAFTAIAGYSDSIYAFKADRICRVAGDYPASYYLYTYDVPGVRSGAAGTVQIAAGVLYYLGPDGVYAYSGGAPELISADLGYEISASYAGTDGRRYYLGAELDGATGNECILMFDPLYGFWAKLSAYFSAVRGFANIGTDAHYAFGKLAEKIGISPAASLSTGNWGAVFAPCDEGTFCKKDYRWLRLRYEKVSGASFTVLCAQDGSGAWETVYSDDGTGDTAGTVNIPLAPMRCSSIQFQITGIGGFCLKQLTRDYLIRSEV